MHPPVTIVLGGACVRAIFSDAYGDRRLPLCEAQIALEGPGATIVSGSDRRLTTMGKAVTRIGDPP
jgi:hypothetical protein